MNILITGAITLNENFKKNILELNNNIMFQQHEKDELICDYLWVEGVICNSLFLYHDITKFKNLKYIQLTSAGYDRVPLDYITKNNIKIYNAKGVYSIPMAEFVISSVLQIYKQSRFFNDNQKKHIWEKNRNLLELFGKNVCILGCGNVGTECAKRFKAFECNVYGVDINIYQNKYFDEIINIKSLNEILPKGDIVVLTLPLTSLTKHLFDKNKFNLMKENAILINISRGAIINTDDLINYSSKLNAIILDVFEEEPLNENSPLWNMSNVIITPHNSFVGENNNARLYKLILNNLRENI